MHGQEANIYMSNVCVCDGESGVLANKRADSFLIQIITHNAALLTMVSLFLKFFTCIPFLRVALLSIVYAKPGQVLKLWFLLKVCNDIVVSTVLGFVHSQRIGKYSWKHSPLHWNSGCVVDEKCGCNGLTGIRCHSLYFSHMDKRNNDRGASVVYT